MFTQERSSHRVGLCQHLRHLFSQPTQWNFAQQYCSAARREVVAKDRFGALKTKRRRIGQVGGCFPLKQAVADNLFLN